jgi:adenylate cyclase
VSYGNVSPEGDKSEVSWGSLYLPGGFFIRGGDPMATQGYKRKLTTVLSADVAGYSRLMGEDEAATVKTLTTYRGIMADLIKQHRGRVIDSPGDNVLAEFTSVVDAVQCAVAVQKEFQARNAELPENRRMQFRIGINLGDVIDEEDRLYGDGVNIAARLEALADPGGICVSKTAFDHIETKLPLGYEYLGEQEVKNIAKPVGAYRVLMEPRITVAEEIEKEKALPTWRRKTVLLGGVAVLIVAIALAIWDFYFRTPPIEPASIENMAFPLPDKPSVAVLPFANIGGDPKEEYFGDGLTDEIITALSKVPHLFVIARNSTFRYKDKPVKVQQVAEELGVRYVLEGSVRRAEERVRITVQLIDALKGHHVWAERYDRLVKDIFVVQDEITMEILKALQVKLTAGDKASLIGKGTDNLEAYQKCLKALEEYERFSREGNILARQLCEEAIALAPDYPSAYRILGWTHFSDATYGWSKSRSESFKKAVELAQKTLELDDTQAAAHCLLGMIYLFQRQYDRAIAEGERAVSISPSGTHFNAILAQILNYTGRPEEGIEYVQKAMRLSPIYPAWFLHRLGMAYRLTGRYDEAIEALKRYRERNPEHVHSYTELAIAYGQSGRMEDANALVEELLKKKPKFCLERYEKTRFFKDHTELERELDVLRKAGLPLYPALPLPDKPSIAVLPFANVGGTLQEYLCDGITENIITSLSKTPKLFVIARNSSFTYKGKPVKVQQVGRELGVRYILEGSIQSYVEWGSVPSLMIEGTKMRITAQLVDAATGKLLWAERYDRDLKDIFALQDEITMKILTAMQVKLTEGEEARLIAKGTENLEAYLRVLQGREYSYRLNKEDNARTRKICKEAIALDPEYPVPYAILGWTHWHDVFLGWSKSPRESMKQAVASAQKCIALDASLSVAHGLLSAVNLMQRQHAEAILEAEKAVALDPSSADDHARLGNVFNFSGRPEEAILAIEKAIRLNPFPPCWYFHCLGMAYRETGRYEESIIACKKALQREPTNLYAHLVLAATYSLLNRQKEASASATEALRISPKFSLDYLAKSRPHIDPANTARFIEALRKAGLK